MNIKLKGINTSKFIEFIKQFKGFSDSIFLEFEKTFLACKIANSSSTWIRVSKINYSDFMETTEIDKPFRISFYSLTKTINSLGFEKTVDFDIQLEKGKEEIYSARSIKSIGENTKILIPCMDSNIEDRGAFIKDELILKILTNIDPIEFNINGEQVKILKQLSSLTSAIYFTLNCGVDGIQVEFSSKDASFILSKESTKERIIHFTCDVLNELSSGESKVRLETDKLISIDGETISVFKNTII